MIKDRPFQKYRHELKYIISRREDSILSSRLEKIFPRDAHANSNGIYRVSSLYFDTPDEKALREKIDGVNNREKFRLRFYGEEPGSFQLEKKMKINGLCLKQNTILTREQTEDILSGRYDFIRESGNPLLLELYSKIIGELLVPKTIVIYDREAFIYEPGNVRITIDRNLRTSISSRDFLDEQKNYFDISDKLSVLELKYDEFIPDIVRLAIQLNLRQTANSKYATCRKYD